MNNRQKIIRLVMFIIFVIAFLVARYLGVNAMWIISIIGILAAVVYIRESIKNNYGKSHIAMSILTILLAIGILIYIMLPEKYGIYGICDIAFITVVIIIMFIILTKHYFKVADKGQKIFMKIVFGIVFGCIAFIAIVELLSYLGILI